MLGRTHITNSLVLLHGGLLFAGQYRYTKEPDAQVNDITIFDYTIDDSLSVVDYGLILGITTVLVLLLLRIGITRKKKQLIFGYMGVLFLLLVGLFLLSENQYGVQTAFIFMFFTLGSVFPDIDSEKSTIGRYIKPISRSIPHRTITHTIWVVLFLGILTLYFSNIYLLAFSVGYTIHIIQDSFSRQGIAWLYPITGYTSYSGGATMKKGRKNPIFSYRTGETIEAVILILSVLAHIGLFVGYLMM